MAARKGGSRERLLNAAETLFAERGFDGTSTRDIAVRAGDTLGTLSYHFPSKDKLLIDVFHRRFDELAELRRKAYRECEASAQNGEPTLREVIAAIVLPFFERAMGSDQAWVSYTRLLGRVLYTGTPEHIRTISVFSDPVAREMVGWLRRVAPHASEADLGYAFKLMLGSMVDTASRQEDHRLSHISNSDDDAASYEEIKGRLLVFIEAGLKALLKIEDA